MAQFLAPYPVLKLSLNICIYIFFFFLQFVGGSYTTINLVYGFFQNFIIARLWVLRKLKMSQP
jgi:hypothetical protein